MLRKYVTAAGHHAVHSTVHRVASIQLQEFRSADLRPQLFRADEQEQKNRATPLSVALTFHSASLGLYLAGEEEKELHVGTMSRISIRMSV